MRVSFDDVVPELLRICLSYPGFRDLRQACLVRDLVGRARLVLDPAPDKPGLPLEALEQALKTALGGYFAPPILSTQGPAEQARLARLILQPSQSSSWPTYWPGEIADTFGTTSKAISPPEWRAVHRLLSKESWLQETVSPPWSLDEAGAPAIVSFYSFKGGVGRTTLLSLVARRLAAEGHRVAVVDLDLEAPGAASLLSTQSNPGRGVLDFIVDHIATGGADISGLHASARAVNASLADRIEVFGAGRLELQYIEKLGRLDYATSRSDTAEESPVARALTELLRQIRFRISPAFILIDARAGLHDLGGLSLHALAHVDVLVSRANPQGLAGLAVTLDALTQRKAPEDFQCILVHGMAPLPADGPVGKQQREWFRDEVYTLFENIVYPRLKRADPPQPSDTNAAHYPWPMGRREEIELAQHLGEISPATLDAEDIGMIAERILELSRPDQPDDNKDTRGEA